MLPSPWRRTVAAARTGFERAPLDCRRGRALGLGMGGLRNGTSLLAAMSCGKTGGYIRVWLLPTGVQQ
jgi:hypothetical protein